MRLFAVAGLICCLAFSRVAAAQDVAAELAKLSPENFEGFVKSASAGGVLAQDAATTPYDIKFVPKISKVDVTGTAKRDYLRPGMAMRFSIGTIDKRGNGKGELKDLAIFTPEPGHQPGVFEEAGGSLVVGAVVSLGKTGKLTLNAGNAKVTVEVPEDAKIDVILNDYSVAREGDKIKVAGRIVKKEVGSPVILAAETMTIELVEPLSGAKKKPAKKPATPKKPR